VPEEKVAELIDFSKGRVFADPPTPVRRATAAQPVLPAAGLDLEPSGASSDKRVNTVRRVASPSSNDLRNTSESEWKANVLLCRRLLTADC